MTTRQDQGTTPPTRGRTTPAKAKTVDDWNRSALPPNFDVDAWTRQVCERSGVTHAVTDPVALAKLRVLTRRNT